MFKAAAFAVVDGARMVLVETRNAKIFVHAFLYSMSGKQADGAKGLFDKLDHVDFGVLENKADEGRRFVRREREGRRLYGR